MRFMKVFSALLIILAVSLPASDVMASPIRGKMKDSAKKAVKEEKQTVEDESEKPVEIVPATVGKPQDLLAKGNVKGVDEIVESIERVMDSINMSCRAYEGNQEIFVSATGEARVVKCHFDDPETVPLCEELDKHMKSYSYPEYDLDVYYDCPEAGEDPINEGPICITGHIGDNFYTYYFTDNTLIRRETYDTSSDNIKTNDFLNKMYKIVWKYQNIENTEYLSVTDAPRSGDRSELVTDDLLTSCLSQKYTYLKKKFGANKEYREIKKELEEYPFWFYALTYDDTSFLLYSDNDKVFGLYSSAENFWDIPGEGINVWELVERTDATVNDIYVEECLGEMFVGDEGDDIISLEIEDGLFSMAVDNGIIYPDTSVQVWKITD